MNTPGPSPEPGPGEIRWTEDAEARVARAPVFLRGMVRRLAEKRARAETVSVLGLGVSMRTGAFAFCLLAVVTAVMLGRAAWSRDP